VSKARRISFAKMEGAGNDFVVLEGAPSGDDAGMAPLVRSLCHRRRGVGADGALWIERLPAGGDDVFRMHFFNRDGRRVNLCLNGSRCVALRASELGWATGRFSFRTELSRVEASVAARGRVSLWVAAPRVVDAEVELPPGSVNSTASALDTGDPHLVVALDAAGWDAMDFERDARALRLWDGGGRFTAGNNVHFVRTDVEPWRIRSFERGVEAETWACGSGCLAAAASLGRGGRVSLRTKGADLIELTADGERWILTGPARSVFEGEFHWDGADVEID
jgi:diaminopimelate epimerase